MNRRIAQPTPDSLAAADQFARRLTARLDHGVDDLPYDITERLRAGRMQALDKRKRLAVAVTKPVPAETIVINADGTASMGWGSEGGNWWRALMSAIPVAALVVGLLVVNATQSEMGASEIAEVDAALLIDDLPPAAYTDPGFQQFIKASHQNP